MSSATSLLIAAVTLIIASNIGNANPNLPPKFLRAARGASKALHATSYGDTVVPLPWPRKVEVQARLSRDVVTIPRSRYYNTGHNRSRRRKTQRKKVKKRGPPPYGYGIPIYAQKFKYYRPHKRPSRYKSRPPSSRHPPYIRVPPYKNHELVEESEDYEGEYDVRNEPPHDFEEDEEKYYRPPSKYHYENNEPPPLPPRKDKHRYKKYSSKYRGGQNLEWQESRNHNQQIYNDNGYRTIIPRPPQSRPPQPRPYSSQHPAYEEYNDRPHSDSEPAYSNYQNTESSQVTPPYIITSNNYGGRYNYQYSHQFAPPNNRPNNNNYDQYNNNHNKNHSTRYNSNNNSNNYNNNNSNNYNNNDSNNYNNNNSNNYNNNDNNSTIPKPFDADIGYGQGLEVVDDDKNSWEQQRGTVIPKPPQSRPPQPRPYSSQGNDRPHSDSEPAYSNHSNTEY